MKKLSRFAIKRAVDRELLELLEWNKQLSGENSQSIPEPQQAIPEPQQAIPEPQQAIPEPQQAIPEVIQNTEDNCHFNDVDTSTALPIAVEDSSGISSLPNMNTTSNNNPGLLASNEDIVKELALLYSSKKLSLSALGAVAKLIKRLGHDIPTSPVTILKTTNTPQRQGKHFHHFSLKKGLLAKLKKGMVDMESRVVKIQINIDGTQIFKTNSLDFWPILCRVTNSLDALPFVVSLFIGKGKPPNLEEYLKPFLEELIALESEGLEFSGIFYSIELSAFVCDAPARAFLKQISGHTGYHGCERCNQKGVYDLVYRCTTFPKLIDLSLRSDASFRAKLHRRHHKGSSPLLELKIGMISGFPLDYMHLVLLGVFKRLLTIWTGQWSKKHFKHKLGTWERAELERRLNRIRLSYPQEFHRVITTLKYAKSLKAVELRALLLYTGPVIFKGILPTEQYNHFLYLHLAIRILCSPTLCETYSDVARNCLQYFSFQFGEIYGKNHLVYNVHSIVHLVDDCELHGPLDSFSAFPFETYLGMLKLLIRSPNKVMSQMIRRISELENISEFDRTIKTSLFNPENPVTSVSSLKTYLKINTRKDSYYLCENGTAVKLMGLSDTHVSIRFFTNPRNLYREPMKSKNIDIFKSDGLEANIKILPINELKLVAKCWVLPLTTAGCCVIPLLHHA